MKTIALDFDGVLCDSAPELAISGYRGANVARSQSLLKIPPDAFMHHFRSLRPVIETGYESIILAELILRDCPLAKIRTHFRASRKRIMDDYGLNRKEMIMLFGNIRDQWINDDCSGWLDAHVFYPGVVNSLHNFLKSGCCIFIITTKEKRFAIKLLKSQGIDLPQNNVFGLGEGRKSKVLYDLTQKPNLRKNTLCFVEDRLRTLEKVCFDKRLNSVQLFLATWGYTTREQIKIAKRTSRINLLKLNSFATLCKGV